MPMPGPRTRRISRSPSASSSSPWNRIEPAATRAGGFGSRPMIESAVTLLPLPDSPTMPSTSPSATSNPMSSTAGSSPRPLPKTTRRLRTDSSVTAGS
jgi:hypothetical protein